MDNVNRIAKLKEKEYQMIFGVKDPPKRAGTIVWCCLRPSEESIHDKPVKREECQD